MVEVNVLGARVPIPTFGIGTGAATIALSIFLIIFAGAIVIWYIFIMRTYNKKIVVFENISGQGFQPVFKDRARTIKLGSGGEELLFLKKKKVYRTAYGRKMGKNTFWFAIGQDGYWYNVVLGDIDAKMGMLDIEPIDRDMRYMHVAIRKNIQDAYNKQNWMEKYGTIAMSAMFLVIIIIGLYFLLDKIADISGAAAGAVESAKTVQDATRQILSSLDNICSSSGIRPVG